MDVFPFAVSLRPQSAAAPSDDHDTWPETSAPTGRDAERGSGLNRSPNQPFDNAPVTTVEPVTMDRGQGTVKGTGTFKVGKATVAFAGLKGTGAFITVFASPTNQTTAWSGAFTPPPAQAARR
ncbi:hypothetical protein MKK63_31290 [Methylobacterium sp. J-088]|uniref:hypothetical protein n=1 Tax=Methylobacterium sp. J-088 TaxID=2836664 RepID=UPI001FBB7CD5|nr:hypothetical protein [Methylobacterium sp. J-088]MCJ2067143.1 hypothetical protein [Methylobacterium sp. J-088]